MADQASAVDEGMAEVVAALRAQRDELAGYVADATAEELLRPSRCPGWTVADVLLHLAQTDEAAAASVTGGLSDGNGAGFLPEAWSDYSTVDELAGQMVEDQREGPEAIRDRWLAGAAAQLATFEAADPSARVPWVVGLMAARTLATTRLTECWIHTVDVAVAFGPPPAPTDRLQHTCRLVHLTVPYALEKGGHEAAGPVAFVLEGPNGDTWTYGDADASPTVLRGAATDLCEVAGQRAAAIDTGLTAEGPDAEATLRLMRTFA
jgi:uncharacterized protein (TIGR03084 family)